MEEWRLVGVEEWRVEEVEEWRVEGVAGVQIFEWLMDGRPGWAQYVPI